MTLPLAVPSPFTALPALAAPDPVPRPGRKPSARPGGPGPARRPRLVMLDPGHGGADPGAIGTRGTQEKEVTLDIAREVARLLGERHRVTARLTRSDDRFLALEERVAITRKADADLLVSIHADSAPNPQARGLSAYTLSDKASDAFASRLAQRENQADRFAGPDWKGATKVVKDILLDLTARHTRNASLIARQTLVRGAGKDLRLLDNPMRSANFAVLKAPDVPSVLVETGFLSNPRDEEILRDAKARRVVAHVLAREIATVLTLRGFA
ncbi:N-acetylmuramoyl-L-alanine amidase [Azospirillum agricola]|uniref:N-acetylmuramoyl-L-alanine amidase family protein n=1 Tax=Azospirillum agricola TaxID=1720247 RepID=UPI001F158587|nr:N-acetylmuramoyl-L-alanine amidase [Azospirillum agricola]MBP2231510.1 N-acetylmuramoyl-L-alanine amidase [Azospirillum agricola]